MQAEEEEMSKVLETWMWERSFHSGSREIEVQPVMGEIHDSGEFEKLFQACAVIRDTGGSVVYKSGEPCPTMEEAKESLAKRLVSEAGTVLSSSDD